MVGKQSARVIVMVYWSEIKKGDRVKGLDTRLHFMTFSKPLSNASYYRLGV
ncbi:MAG: hypothetical protein ACOC3S_03285 [Bacteroidota bacterium]